MEPGPAVAVVVGDFDRRRYVGDALASLARQTLDRSRFEVVLLTGYSDPVHSAESARVRRVEDRSPRIGAWLARGIAATRAPIVTFLNDDDAYEPDRLARVVEQFERYPDLVFYRNRVAVLNADGSARPTDAWRTHERDAAFDTTGPVRVAPGDRARAFELGARTAFVTFNTSTMAIRRTLLDGPTGAVFLRTQTDDQFLFVAAALSDGGMFLDDRRLTRFRFHPGSLTDETRWLGEAEDSYRDLAELSARAGRRDFADWMERRSVHFGRMFRGDGLVDAVAAAAGRRAVARRTAEYLRFLGRHPAERAMNLDTWAAGLYGLAYASGAPGVARVARTRKSARARA